MHDTCADETSRMRLLYTCLNASTSVVHPVQNYILDTHKGLHAYAMQNFAVQLFCPFHGPIAAKILFSAIAPVKFCNALTAVPCTC